MTWLEMADSSAPVTPPPPTPVQAFYIGGDTPHIWSDSDIATIKARYVLPIYVNTNPAADVNPAADHIISWLHAHHYAHGQPVCVDTESIAMPAFITALDSDIKAAGFTLIEYESKGPLHNNPVTSGGRWIADWTGTPHLYPGSVATQYADSKMAGLPWDESVIDQGVPLHEQNPPVTHPIPWADITCHVPLLVGGDKGPAVSRMQGLLEAWHNGATGPQGIDGIFGPDTLSALRQFQRMHGNATGSGVCDGPTWQLLITA